MYLIIEYYFGESNQNIEKMFFDAFDWLTTIIHP
jgi:hypothetical protein